MPKTTGRAAQIALTLFLTLFVLVAALPLIVQAACTQLPGLKGDVVDGGVCVISGDTIGLCHNETCISPVDYGKAVAAEVAKDAEKSSTPKSAKTIAPRTLDNPLGTGTTLFDILGRALTLFTSIAGSVALLMFVYGGIMWVSSGGATERIETGRKAMAYAVIGLVIIFGSYAILRAVFLALGATL